jgi:hypothetical protein
MGKDKSEKIATGDCFVWTGKYAINNFNKVSPQFISPTGNPLTGNPLIIHASFKILYKPITIAHAFLEDDNLVYDKAGRKYVVSRKSDYYAKKHKFKAGSEIFVTKIKEFKKYTCKELYDLMVAGGHKFQKFGIETDF